MSHRLCLFVNVDGIGEKQRLPTLLTSLERIRCRQEVSVRRMKKNPWVQLDGIPPEDAESVASKVAADLKSQVVLLEEESTSSAFRYIKYDWKEGQYGREVLRWVYGFQSSGGWNECLGDPEAPEFALIVEIAAGAKGTRRQPRKPSKTVQLRTPDLFALGRLLNLPGIDVSDEQWTEEQSYHTTLLPAPTNFFDLFKLQLWDLDEIDELIANGVDPNQRLTEAQPGCFRELAEMTPLEDLLSKISCFHLLVRLSVEKLIQAGADPNRFGTLTTPLANAVDTGVVELVATLLKNGARVDLNHNRDDKFGLKELIKSAPTTQIENALKLAAEATPAAKPKKTATSKKAKQKS